MDPITIGIATAIGAGLAQVSTTLINKGIVEPALQPAIDRINKRVTKSYDAQKDDLTMLTAVQTALKDAGAPDDEDALNSYLINRGFAQLQAEGSDALRKEIAQAALLHFVDDPKFVPDRLFKSLRMPQDSRPLLSTFLYSLRNGLKKAESWQTLMTVTDIEGIRQTLHQMAHDTQRTLKEAELRNHYLKQLVDFYEISDVTDEEALKNYLDFVESRFEHINFVLAKAKRRDKLTEETELETIFVPLQVQDPEAKNEHPEKRRRGAKRRIANPFAEEPEFKERNPLLTVPDVLEKYDNFIFIGPPGSGKTTLLRHLVLSFAKGEAKQKLNWQKEPLLPILVPLRNFGRFLKDNRQEYTSPAPLALRHFIDDYFKENAIELSPMFFHKRLKQGRCLLLLDGLDEVSDREERATVAQFVSRFIRHYAKGNRFGLASRPKGYEDVKTYLPKPIECYVKELTPQDRDKLVQNLLVELVPNPRTREQNSKDLLADIHRKAKVEELTRNPLFCTTLVLVYQYHRASLPERRVDVYQELVDLMLGFWEAHKLEAGVVDVHELARWDGTGRSFVDEKDAVKAKEKALMHLAYWMVETGQTEVPKEDAVTFLANWFLNQGEAEADEKDVWAQSFLDVSHQRSGLFVEFDTETYAFSHKNFLEYLAATALVNKGDNNHVNIMLEHAEEQSWEEVLLLAFAHEKMPEFRYELLVEKMLEAGYVQLAGKCAVDAGERLSRPLLKSIRHALELEMVNDAKPPKVRWQASVILDETGWLPDEDLNQWIRCDECADDGGDLLVMKYPVTNWHFARFMAAGGYENPVFWGGEKSEAWQWRVQNHGDYRGEAPVVQPEYWYDGQLGKGRQGFPVVGISWYEAMAYANWLTSLLGKETPFTLPLEPFSVKEVRLPTENEWENVAGGAENDRYPWDLPSSATAEKADIIKRANTRESGIMTTSQVAMYPQGASYANGVMDLAGNVWEWQSDWYDEDEDRRVLRGGSWNNNIENARVAIRNRNNPTLLSLEQ